MSDHLPAVRPARILSWRQLKRGIAAMRRRARSSAAACDDASIRDVELSRWEPMFKLPNRFNRSR